MKVSHESLTAYWHLPIVRPSFGHHDGVYALAILLKEPEESAPDSTEVKQVLLVPAERECEDPIYRPRVFTARPGRYHRMQPHVHARDAMCMFQGVCIPPHLSLGTYSPRITMPMLPQKLGLAYNRAKATLPSPPEPNLGPHTTL